MGKLNSFNKIKRYLKQKEEYFIHETKRAVLTKFLLILLIFALYFIFISFEYGLENGIYILVLTWSFFVLCTPIADAGFLLDFPIRLITNIKMFYTEIFVWLIALTINAYSLIFNPAIYSENVLLTIFKEILTNHWPFNLVIIVSGIGTFLSIYFGDELISVAKHEEKINYKKHGKKYEFVLLPMIVIATIILYYMLLNELGIRIDF